MKSKEQYVGDVQDMYSAEIKSVIDFNDGFDVAKKLFEPKWINVGEKAPPKNESVLAKSPEGVIHICNWREAYNIFTVQTKDESSFDWKWMEIPE